MDLKATKSITYSRKTESLDSIALKCYFDTLIKLKLNGTISNLSNIASQIDGHNDIKNCNCGTECKKYTIKNDKDILTFTYETQIVKLTGKETTANTPFEQHELYENIIQSIKPKYLFDICSSHASEGLIFTVIADSNIMKRPFTCEDLTITHALKNISDETRRNNLKREFENVAPQIHNLLQKIVDTSITGENLLGVSSHFSEIMVQQYFEKNNISVITDIAVTTVEFIDQVFHKYPAYQRLMAIRKRIDTKVLAIINLIFYLFITLTTLPIKLITIILIVAPQLFTIIPFIFTPGHISFDFGNFSIMVLLMATSIFVYLRK
jgi:hypothetical protein